MEITKKLGKLILAMREFQKRNNIQKECVTNVQYLYNVIKQFTSSGVEAKPVIVINCNGDSVKYIVHMVLVIDNDVMVDPSYEIFSLQNAHYFDNIKDLLSNFPLEYVQENIEFKETLADTIKAFNTFIRLANQINSGELTICSKDFYEKQANYINSLQLF